MSVITGIYNLNNEFLNINYGIRLMTEFEKYPSNSIQVWHNQTIFFGCHAQWITSESIGEKLPFYDHERKIVVTADAIIDNREELFEVLQVEYSLRKRMPDSQLIILAYSKWGEDLAKFLIGDFVFIIWDEKQQKLYGARDFSGSRTLYYYQDKEIFSFSTLIKPLLALPNYKKRLNHSWLAEFIAIPTLVEAADMTSTVYHSIHQVPPSHSITVTNGEVKLKRYCTINVDQELKLSSNEEYIEAFHEVFGRAVKDRLRTNGKVGSHLSGGLDSGTVVSFAADQLKKNNKKLHTFSYIPEADFEDWTSDYYVPDERPFIKETVNYVGNISDNYMSFPGASPLSEVDEFLDIMEMPYKFFENTFWLKGISEAASKQGISVMLNGARGNHSISWGSMRLNYDYYSTLLKQWRWIQLNHELTSFCTSFRTGKSVMVPFLAKRAFPALRALLTKQEEPSYPFPSFINPALAKSIKVYEKLQEFGMQGLGESVSDLNQYRSDYYRQLYPWNKSGVANTKLSLRYGVWDRDPTNDLRVINFCLSLPKEQYVLGGLERSFLRRATKNKLPNKVRLNQEHRGLQGADVIHRMKKDWGSFMQELKKMSNDSMLSELIDTKIIKNAISNLGNEPRQEMVVENDFKILTRSLILYRFLQKQG
ncbi:asparagine synthetase B [Sutcliffiella horikoshii]|uniref:asparagine synthase-related protein n=1 Tax=Sutcliffiella horikoshii TaxID=79883 RepID=UPI00384CFE10